MKLIDYLHHLLLSNSYALEQQVACQLERVDLAFDGPVLRLLSPGLWHLQLGDLLQDPLVEWLSLF